MSELEFFLVATPGLERVLFSEVQALGFTGATLGDGGVTVHGSWRDVWRANLMVRGTSRVLVRLGTVRVLHLAQLDKRMRKFPWSDFLRADVPVRVECTCKGSRIYHGGAAAQRIETAIREELGAVIADDAALVIKARIDDDMCTVSVDTSGESLHKRGSKEAVGKAPMRETLASLFLRDCGFSGTEPVVDPMCGSGTFVIEAAEIAAGLWPGRARAFAFEQLAHFDARDYAKLRQSMVTRESGQIFHGFDRDAGAIAMAKANAARAGVGDFAVFQQQAISGLAPPAGAAGLVIINPPYGARIGNKKPLRDLYAAIGKVLLQRFSGWRVGLIATDKDLIAATGLPILPKSKPILHGGLRVYLFQTGPL